MGTAMFDHVVTRPLPASATSVASVFTMDIHDTGAALKTSVSADIIDGDYRWTTCEALATASKDM